MFKARQDRMSKVGRWRAGTNNKQFKGDGTYIDPDYYLVEEWKSCLNILKSQ